MSEACLLTLYMFSMFAFYTNMINVLILYDMVLGIFNVCKTPALILTNLSSCELVCTTLVIEPDSITRVMFAYFKPLIATNCWQISSKKSLRWMLPA